MFFYLSHFSSYKLPISNFIKFLVSGKTTSFECCVKILVLLPFNNTPQIAGLFDKKGSKEPTFFVNQN